MPTVHYLVARGRDGFAVNVEADILSTFPTRDEALAEAHFLTSEALARGEAAMLLDVEGYEESRSHQHLPSGDHSSS